MINSALKQQFLDLIQSQTGIKLREQDWDTLEKEIVGRVHSLQQPDAHTYYKSLVLASQGSTLCSGAELQEWSHFLDLITIGESYFFRDHDQFCVLQEHILPELIEQQRMAYATGLIPQLALHLWSAGCSTGEEPYSLALLLQKLIPDWSQWHISILGTDLNPVAIDRARQGVYRNWSFRQTDPQLKSQAFNPVPTGWQIHDTIRQQLTFRRGNLLRDPLPQAMVNNLHLIICRNVFIYFDAAAIAQVLAKFHRALRPEGYLVTGHAELYAQNLQQFQTLSFPGSIAYQQRQVEVPAPPPTPSAASPVSPIKTTAPATSTPIDRSTTGLSTQYRLAKSYVQQEDWEQAMHHCQAALEINGEAIAPLYLKAQIAQELGDDKQAKVIYKKIIYLQPTSIPAYLELGTLYQQAAQGVRAAKMYSAAQDLLQQLPGETWINYQGQIRADHLLMHLRQRLLTLTSVAG
ncbi:CheR family methyltransferase [Acaryochloris sp. IP29b_bin.148]|uniref:CheR family methyltransferase n=1 Tax=Acaryochloris sp. IP29b_bin.148 TaxID=2969218 RepID=UPI00262FE3DB|nr:CheR family methyltransferase [Acaryochloris sp. IP29b_bin.148]